MESKKGGDVRLGWVSEEREGVDLRPSVVSECIF